MKSSILFSAAAALESPDWSGYTYSQYTKDFQSKGFSATFNSNAREEVFNQNLKLINTHNSNAEKTWFATVNQFTDLTNEEYRQVIKGSRPDHGLFGGPAQMHVNTGKAVADSKDWRDAGVVTPAKDQGGCGSCWAFSAAETFESHLAIATSESVQDLSAQQIVSCAPNPNKCGGSGGCDGSTQPLAFDYTKTAGLSTTASYRYAGSTGTCDQSKIAPVGFNNGGHAVLPLNNYTALLDAAANVGPVAISIAAGGSTFQFYGGGVMKNCNDFVMDHAVQLVGYGTDGSDDYWLVRNSWGGSWGESGYIRMKRYGEGKEPCGVDSKPQDGDACEGDTAPRTYCGECGILSASSYPTGMSKTQGPTPPTPPPPPTPPTPVPVPSPPVPSPPPTPAGCADTEDSYYCDYVVSQNWCDLIGSDCLKSCNCCDTPSDCGGDVAIKAEVLKSLHVTV